MHEGPQALGPLLPVEVRPGIDLPAVALHAALRVRLFPEQKVRTGQGSWEGSGLPPGLWQRSVPMAGWVAGLLMLPSVGGDTQSGLGGLCRTELMERQHGSCHPEEASWSVPRSSSVSRTSGPLLHLTEPQRPCAVFEDSARGRSGSELPCGRGQVS